MKRLNTRIESENKDLPPHRPQEPVPHYSPHDCRHTAASRRAQSGIPLYDMQALLGHSSYQTTQRYAHLVPGGAYCSGRRMVSAFCAHGAHGQSVGRPASGVSRAAGQKLGRR
ncbi:tyrosine-type recombinase/integrase [Herbidospora galbida]|uniref:tyrosine-type recombinase/integrase n=1 Tax=Herbidospora galbida TaxID=2575442 RepID=UPI001BAF4E3D